MEPDGLPRLVGPGQVAKWCGVDRSAVNNWLRRYENYPTPAAILVANRPYGNTYLWREDQQQEWLDWFTSAHD